MQIFSDYEIGAKLNYHYLNSRPFPHIVLDNFINSNTATQCFNELKTTDHWATESSNNAYREIIRLINFIPLGLKKVQYNYNIKLQLYITQYSISILIFFSHILRILQELKV